MVAGVLKDACDAAGIPMADAAMRWCKHHSILDADVGDGIIFGASSSSHAEHNIAAYGAGPLPDTIVNAMDAAYVNSSLSPQSFKRTKTQVVFELPAIASPQVGGSTPRHRVILSRVW